MSWLSSLASLECRAELEISRQRAVSLEQTLSAQSILIGSLNEDLEVRQTDNESLQNLHDSLEESQMSLRRQRDELQLALEKSQATCSKLEHEKELLAQLHDMHVERINAAIASIGLSYASDTRSMPENRQDAR